MGKKIDAVPFMKHQFKKDAKFMFSPPKIFISRKAYEDMQYIVGLADEEVGWLGTVYRRDKNFLIDEIFLVEQETNTMTCEMLPEGVANLATELLKRENGTEVYNALRFWGHSHIRMETSPSSQDNKQMEDFLENCEDFFIRGILNKKGRIELDLYLVESNFCLFDCEWELEANGDDDRLAFWEKEIEKKVKGFSRGSWGHNPNTGASYPGNQQDLWDDGYGYNGYFGLGVNKKNRHYKNYPYGGKPDRSKPSDVTKHKGQTGIIVNDTGKKVAAGNAQKKTKEKIKKRKWIVGERGRHYIKGWI